MDVKIHPLAGKPVTPSMLVDVGKLRHAFYALRPDIKDPRQLVSFGTSGHRGSALKGTFNEDHILAITQAIVDYRNMNGISGPLFLGMDTHASSEQAMRTALEVLAANDVQVIIHENGEFTPTPVISHAILTLNKGKDASLADGIIITPSHNPPEDGGLKYNPPHGGPADTGVTDWIQNQANSYLKNNNVGVKRTAFEKALRSPSTHAMDLIRPYVNDLTHVVDMASIRESGIKIGVDPLGGAAVNFWDDIGDRYGLNLDVVNRQVDPTFRFMRVDADGKIRMDCSSPWAMAGLVELKAIYDIAFGNDTDADRHGIVDANGLMNPNHFLSVAIWYLSQNRPEWSKNSMVGKTIVSSSMIDRVAAHLGRKVYEVPVGFKWFVQGLLDGSCGFGGEESAGASFLRLNGKVWTTDKDGIILGLLAAEIKAKTGRDPSQIYRELTARFGDPAYERIDTSTTPEQQAAYKNLTENSILATVTILAGDIVTSMITKAPGNGANIGGIKITTKNGWFAARPSGTEPKAKLYAESFLGPDHLKRIQAEALEILKDALG